MLHYVIFFTLHYFFLLIWRLYHLIQSSIRNSDPWFRIILSYWSFFSKYKEKTNSEKFFMQVFTYFPTFWISRVAVMSIICMSAWPISSKIPVKSGFWITKALDGLYNMNRNKQYLLNSCSRPYYHYYHSKFDFIWIWIWIWCRKGNTYNAKSLRK